MASSLTITELEKHFLDYNSEKPSLTCFFLFHSLFAAMFQAVLVHSLQSCVCKYLKWLQTKDDHPATTNDKDLDNGRGIPEGVESAQEVLVSTVSRMIKSDPEDFELDKSSDFSSGSSVGRKNRTVAALVAGVYEVKDQ